MQIDGRRLIKNIEDLGKIGLDAQGRRSRTAASDADKAARDLVCMWMEEAGMRPQLVMSRLDKLAAKIVPTAHSLANEVSAEWPSGLYAKIEAVVAEQVATVLATSLPTAR